MPGDDLIRILVVDDHPLVREGVQAVIEGQDGIVLAGEAEDGLSAVERYRALRPDVTLMDISMRGMSGLEALAEIRKEDPQARIIILTTYAGDAQAVRALEAGAVGYLLKSSLRKELVSTIRTVHAGGRYVTTEVANAIAFNSRSETLSDREIEVLRLVADGRANKEVGHRLGVTEDTIKAHLKSIFVKLDVSDRTHAVTVALRRGILTL